MAEDTAPCKNSGVDDEANNDKEPEQQQQQHENGRGVGITKSEKEESGAVGTIVDYDGVIEDLRRRGLCSMAEALAKLRTERVAPELEVALEESLGSHTTACTSSIAVKCAVGIQAAPAATIPNPNSDSHLHQDQTITTCEATGISAKGSFLACPQRVKERAQEETPPPPQADNNDVDEKSFVNNGQQESVPCAPASPDQSIMGPPSLTRNDGTSNGMSVGSPGAYNIVSQAFSDGDADTDATVLNPCEGVPGLAINDNGGDGSQVLEAVRVDDIMTVWAEAMKEAPERGRLVGLLVCLFALILVVALSLSLTFGIQSINDTSNNDIVLARGPALGPAQRYDLLHGFVLEAFAPMYSNNSLSSSNLGSLEELLADEESPQSKALEWLALNDEELETSIQLDFLYEDWDTTSTDRERIIQRYVLALLYFATGGPTEWTDSFEFLAPGHECDWSGALGCATSSQTGFKNVSDNDNSGPEYNPASVITYIDLHSNELQGQIVPELGALTHLRTIILSDNSLTGSLPSSLSRLTSLQSFEIAQNQLNGTLAEEFFTNWRALELLYIGDNHFSGTLSSQIGNLNRLQFFGAERLRWQGTVPKEFYRQLTNLEVMEMSNQIYGFVNDTLATEIGLWSKLRSFIFHGAELVGSIPTELGSATNLSRLQLASNHLSGTIPSELGLLTAMTRLQLSTNGLTGAVPESFAKFANVVRMELQNTLLTGAVDFLCEAIDAGNMSAIDNLQFDMNEVSGCYCCSCCEY